MARRQGSGCIGPRGSSFAPEPASIPAAASLLSDSVAIACQSLLGAAFGSKNWSQANQIITRTMRFGLVLGAASAALLAMLAPALPKVFTNDPATKRLLRIFVPVIALTQPLSALAFVMDGVIYGAGGFAVAAKLMGINAAPSILSMIVGCKLAFRRSPTLQLAAIWAGLVVFMLMRGYTIWWVLETRQAPFEEMPRMEEEQGTRGQRLLKRIRKSMGIPMVLSRPSHSA